MTLAPHSIREDPSDSRRGHVKGQYAAVIEMQQRVQPSGQMRRFAACALGASLRDTCFDFRNRNGGDKEPV